MLCKQGARGARRAALNSCSESSRAKWALGVARSSLECWELEKTGSIKLPGFPGSLVRPIRSSEWLRTVRSSSEFLDAPHSEWLGVLRSSSELLGSAFRSGSESYFFFKKIKSAGSCSAVFWQLLGSSSELLGSASRSGSEI